jgi:hypothetical protein
MSFTERLKMMFALRLRVSADQQLMFSHNALRSAREKISTVAIQGFGRFGPFGPSHSDSTIRFDPYQDAGACIWLPWVAAGGVWAFCKGRAQWLSGKPPTAWAILAQFGVTLAIVTAYIPMAWDRYLLPLQVPACLLAAGVAAAAAAQCARAVKRIAASEA